MRYLGGKAQIARYVADVICAELRPGQAVWEPFCGGLNVTAELGRRGVDVIATDASVPLMALLMAVRDGWIPPATLSEAEWHAARARPAGDVLRLFAEHCCFAGIYAGSYPRDKRTPKGEYQIGGQARALLRDVPGVALIACVDFLAVEPEPLDVVIYCDPPYAGRTGYKACAPFDHARFVERVQAWAQHCTVLVSEYALSVGELVWSRERCAYLRGAAKTHIERIYRLRPEAPCQS